MICPHCKMAIRRGVDDDVKARIFALWSSNFSVREIEKILFAEGVVVSSSQVSKILNTTTKQKE